MTKEIFVVGDLNVLATFLDRIAGNIFFIMFDHVVPANLIDTVY